MADVFISYSCKDKEFVQRLHAALVAHQRDVWVDWEDIPPTADWRAEISASIDSADSFVFVLSPDSINSQVCGEELERAVKNNKRIIPIVCRDVDPPMAKPAVAQLNWIFCRAIDDFSTAVELLIRALDTDLDWVKAHTRLLTRAIEWDTKKRDGSLALRGRDLRDAEEWQARATSKEPQPMPLQSEYILASRQAATRQQRITLIGVTAALVIAIVLAIVALFQANAANNARATAVVESNARATEVSVRATAEAKAVMRQLSAESKDLNNTQPDLALLLSVEVNRTSNAVEARSSLLGNLQANSFLVKYLRGHTDKVYTVAFSPDGKLIASGGADRTIVIWDAMTLQPIGRSLVGHKDTVRSIAFSKDGKLLASGSEDKTIIIWDIARRQPIGQSLKGHEGDVRSIAFSPDGQILASGGDNKKIILWNVADQQSRATLFTRDLIGSIAFSPDGKLLASGDDSGNIALWDVAKRQLLRTEPTQDGNWTMGMAFSPDGSILASASRDHIRLWDAATLKLHRELKAHPNWVHSVAFSPDGKKLASASEDHTIILWDLTTYQQIGQPLIGHTGAVSSVVFNKDGTKLVSGGHDGIVILWYTQANPLGQILQAHESGVTSLAFSKDGILASGSGDKRVILWDAAAYQKKGLPLEPQSGVRAVAFSPDGKKLASGSENGRIIFWNIENHQPIGADLTQHRGDILSMAFSPDGKFLASGSRDNTVIIWNVETRRPISPPLVAQPLPSGGGVWSVAFSPDGKTLATGNREGKIFLWDTVSFRLRGQPLDAHDAYVYAMVYSPDGSKLASGGFGRGNSIALFNASTGQLANRLAPKHQSDIRSLAFSPDGSLLASGSSDDTIVLWDIPTLQPLGLPFTAHTGNVNTLAFPPQNAKILASGGSDRKIILWDIDSESWRRHACQIANRNLTRAEWAYYINSEQSKYDTDYSKNPTCPGLPIEPRATPTLVITPKP